MTSLRPSHQKCLPKLETILVIGSGGRENALAWRLSKCPGIQHVWVAPGNGGTNLQDGCSCLAIKEDNAEELINFGDLHKIDLIVIGPESPLADGLADKLRKANFSVFGPSAKGALLEASKLWAKDLMEEAGIPTAKYWHANREEIALKILKEVKQPLVIKVDGLAAGKGVTVSKTIEETILAIDEAFKGKFGEAGNTIVLEEILSGPEVSIFALCDGERMVLLPPAQDHKRLREGDKGPNTGGMGAYAPAPLINSAQLESIRQIILEPTLEALKNRKIDYRGVIYAGLMLTSSGPQVIEFNCRFGDPECQTLIPLLGNELAEVLQACALGKLNECSELSIKDNCSVCIVAAAEGYPESPRKGDLITISLESTPSVQIFHSGTQRNSNGQLITSGGRVISLVAQGETFDKAFTKAYTAMEKIKFSGINFRSDIGHQVRKSFLLS